ncbi:hypothetical protein [Azomonas macrocytogenes]|uniref:Uncharacterized protein n=1 Tax=Azomonas macrocytogenes TaxID=69962 RepID=A0A839T7I1_AZOMA|nr:hypothetical protein [Azomonas macrocytogenes]MBB3105038.1 hypothetical protein [Azomonas macrocytogenes]
MPHTHSHSQPDLAYARNTLTALVEYLRTQPSRNDALVIASIGELQVRINAAESLQQRAGTSATAAIEARLAAVEAARLGSELQRRLTGNDLPHQPAGEPEPLLFEQQRKLGDHYLNAVAIS